MSAVCLPPKTISQWCPSLFLPSLWLFQLLFVASPLSSFWPLVLGYWTFYGKLLFKYIQYIFQNTYFLDTIKVRHTNTTQLVGNRPGQLLMTWCTFQTKHLFLGRLWHTSITPIQMEKKFLLPTKAHQLPCTHTFPWKLALLDFGHWFWFRLVWSLLPKNAPIPTLTKDRIGSKGLHMH